ncbi:MAG: benzoate-CoA ligase family protein [Vicinamibacterales bacterium]
MPASPPDIDIPRRFNFASAVIERRRAAGDGARLAYRCPERTWTFDELAGLAAGVSRALIALGVRRENRVLIALPDSAEFVAAFLGAQLAGAVAVPCNTFLGPQEYAYFLAESRATLMVTHTAIAQALAPAIAAARDLSAVLVVDADADTGLTRAWTQWVDPSALAPPPDTHRDAPAFWLWTSGSTGQPKAAVHAHQDWPWCCEGFGVGVLQIAPDDHVFSAAKLFHAYGLGNGLAFPWWTGASASLLPDRPLPASVAGVLTRDRPTVFMGVPTLYAALVRTLAEDPGPARSLRLAVSAGESLPPEVYRRWRDVTGVELLDAPGSTEVLHCYLSPRPGDVVPGSVGRPVPGYAMRIVDEHGHDVAPGVIGELLVQGRSTATAYWQRRDETTAKMRGRWFASGDQYRMDDEGRYWHIGRTDDMFKVSGEWVAATEVEAALATHAAVVECAVVPEPDESGVLKPRAVVVLAAGTVVDAALADVLKSHVRGLLAGYKVPRTIDIADELPKTATGKIQRFKLRR